MRSRVKYIDQSLTSKSEQRRRMRIFPLLGRGNSLGDCARPVSTNPSQPRAKGRKWGALSPEPGCNGAGIVMVTVASPPRRPLTLSTPSEDKRVCRSHPLFPNYKECAVVRWVSTLQQRGVRFGFKLQDTPCLLASTVHGHLVQAQLAANQNPRNRNATCRHK